MSEDPTLPAPALEPLDPGELRRLTTELLRACGAEKLDRRVSVLWNPRLRSTAGRAFPKQWRIELNPRLQAFPGETSRTLRHELAHLVVAWNQAQLPKQQQRRPRGKPRDPHGPDWRRACALLGIDGESRCHTLALAAPRRVARPHAYECPSCRLVVRRTRPITRGRMLACGICCRQLARGRFDARFKLRKIDPAPVALPGAETLPQV